MLRYVGTGLANLPFSRMAGYGSLLFLSGQVAIDRHSGILEAIDARLQTRVVLENMRADLEKEGLHLCQVVKLTVFVKEHMLHAEAVHEVCRETFAPPFPAITCVAVVRLPHPDALVEVEMIVHREP